MADPYDWLFTDGEFVINPSPKELKNSELELIVAGTRSGLLMVEGETKLVGEDLVLKALKFAHEQMIPVFDAQDELRTKNRKQRQKGNFYLLKLMKLLRTRLLSLCKAQSD